MAKGTVSAVTEESAKCLEDVRKGKPRRFVMVCKGPAIVSLVVYKKGSLEKFKKEAKDAGSGTVSYGIVDGKGPNINFKLARADGFDSEPTTIAKVKALLKEECDLTTMPTFEIVQALGPLLDSDDPSVARFLLLQKSAQKLGAEQPNRAAELTAACAEIVKTLDADSASELAITKMDALEQLLAGLRHDRPSSSSAEPESQASEESSESASELAIELKSRLTALLKKANPCVALVGARLKDLGAEARDAAGSGNQERMEKLLNEGDELVDDALEYQKLKTAVDPHYQKAQNLPGDLAAPIVETMDGVTRQVAELNFGDARQMLNALIDQIRKANESAASFFKEWQEGLAPSLKLLQDAKSTDLEKINELLGQVQGAVSARDWGTATRAYQEADQVVTAALKTARQSDAEQVIPEGAAQSGLTAEQVSRVALAWEASVGGALGDIATVRDEVADSEFAEIRPIAEILGDLLDSFPKGMNATLELLKSAAKNGDERGIKQGQSRAKKNVAECLAFLDANSNVISACEQHPFEIGKIAIAAPLSKALQEVKQLLQS